MPDAEQDTIAVYIRDKTEYKLKERKQKCNCVLCKYVKLARNAGYNQDYEHDQSQSKAQKGMKTSTRSSETAGL